MTIWDSGVIVFIDSDTQMMSFTKTSCCLFRSTSKSSEDDESSSSQPADTEIYSRIVAISDSNPPSCSKTRPLIVRTPYPYTLTHSLLSDPHPTRNRSDGQIPHRVTILHHPLPSKPIHSTLTIPPSPHPSSSTSSSTSTSPYTLNPSPPPPP